MTESRLRRSLSIATLNPLRLISEARSRLKRYEIAKCWRNLPLPKFDEWLGIAT
ncbi:MAG TPA: hypothetical protein IGS17_12000 [Oscillatoriales cyanobacterium M59_W2019_021]|nr:hypothetical protein [Oscillatoriales cyanobacterium M4454_W2019_049]HIK51624.1 hypothetical protein [Oscillatoriales cyanobacterium M59_W2019_021]